MHLEMAIVLFMVGVFVKQLFANGKKMEVTVRRRY